MNYLIYTLTYPLIWLISILPFRVLYFVSDILFVLIYYIFGYRKKVVLNNLQLAFPDKSIEDLLKIRKKFFRHFVDIFMEMIKTFTISKEEMDKHYKYTNVELVQELQKDGKSLAMMFAHYGNWEWTIGLNSYLDYKAYAAFSPIGNKYFNDKILKTREKFGVKLLPSKLITSEMRANYQANIKSIYGLLSDQSPVLRKNVYWTEFLGIKVPVHTGGEALAKKYNMNMVFLETKRVKRGYYETTFKLITNDASQHENYELTKTYLAFVEAQIRKEPAFYFWTHKRFKHKDKAPD